jgi:hypothetical protein
VRKFCQTLDARERNIRLKEFVSGNGGAVRSNHVDDASSGADSKSHLYPSLV